MGLILQKKDEQKSEGLSDSKSQDKVQYHEKSVQFYESIKTQAEESPL